MHSSTLYWSKTKYPKNFITIIQNGYDTIWISVKDTGSVNQTPGVCPIFIRKLKEKGQTDLGGDSFTPDRTEPQKLFVAKTRFQSR
jgi:hypothetical protein